MAKQKSSLELYLHRVSALLECPGRQKQEFIEQLRFCVMEMPDWEAMSEEKIVEIMGTPEEVSVGYLDAEGPGKVFKAVKAKKRAFWIVGIAVIVALVVLIVAVITYVIDAYQFTHGYYIERVYDYEDISEPSQISEVEPRVY